MPQRARLKISSPELENLTQVVEEIKRTAEKSGVRVSGPIPLPTKRLLVTTQKNVGGTGTTTWDKFEMRIHRRVFYFEANERLLRLLLGIRIPEGVKISLDLL
ncbi:MAG: 30S ribosomal protein S10 [Thermoproteota archaeon]